MGKKLHFELREINPDDAKSIEWVQLIRTGEFDHDWFGKFVITEETLRSFKLNFDRKVRKVDLAVDYFHETLAEAAGWFKEIELRENDTQLWIRVEWTDKAKQKILDKEIRYISADFVMDYVDAETKEEFGATLYGAGLTNRPHVKGMQPVFSEECVKQQINNNNERGHTMKFEDIMNAVKDLNDDQKAQLGEKLGFKKASEEDKKMSEVKMQLSEKDSTIKKLSDDITVINKKLACAEKEKDFNILLSNGNAVEAQRDAYMKGDMTEFAKNAVKVNLSEAGSSLSGDGADEAKTAQIKFDEKVAEKVASGIPLKTATSIVYSENSELVKTING